MESVINFVLSLSILFPLVAGGLKFKIIKEEYQPFFWLVVLGFITEIISFLAELYHAFNGSNAIPTNIFVLVEWLLLSYQFYVWGFLKKRKKIFYLLIGLPVLVWITENLVYRQINVFSPYFRILYAFLVTLMAITEINFKITHDMNLFKSPKFIICIGLILFFVYQILYEWAYQVSLIEAPTRFTPLIISLFAYINAFTNIIFGIAFLVIPVRKPFKLE